MQTTTRQSILRHRFVGVAGTLLTTLALCGPIAANEIYVTTTAQKISDTGGCSLQEAIFSANFDSNVAIDSTGPDHFATTECVPGNGDDTIVLPSGAVFPMGSIVDDAHNYMGPTATPIVFSEIVIEANGSRLEHIANGVSFRAFAVGSASVDINPEGSPDVVSGTGNLTIRNAHLKGFTVKGGNGARGGGGGLGAGGAIYVNGGTLTVESSTFQGNGAAGGNAGGVGGGAGGGGGGVAGNGGSAGGIFSGGGGGGGSRGNGGRGDDWTALGGSGGGGGGTVSDGESGDSNPSTGTGELDGGFRCGGVGGHTEIGIGSDDGQDVTFCPGGGGGGGESYRPTIGIVFNGDGGDGGYGGGGGGGGYDIGDGGHGGFGGGGGGSTNFSGDGGSGGDGGFGGGGGGGAGGLIFGGPGDGGTFAGDGSAHGGGGGAALGGAIFNDAGTVLVQNCTFTQNFVVHGLAGGAGAQNGTDAGGAIFSVDGAVTVRNATIAGNESTGEGAGIVMYKSTRGLPASLTLQNTIIADSLPGIRECFFIGSVAAQGTGNLIENNFGCPGMDETEDPQLGPLQINAPGSTPTMEILPTSPAADAADAGTALATDQRGVARPINDGYDIGAFEAREPAADLSITKQASVSTAIPGDTITFDLQVTNNGPDDAEDVQVVDDLPASLTYVSCTSGAGTCGGTGNGRTIDYTALAASAGDPISLTATLNFGVADGTVITNTASVAAGSPDDPNPGNDTASASVTVHNRSDLLISKRVTKLSNRQLRYTITVKNLGPYQARTIVMNDPMPNGTKFVEVWPGQFWTCEPLPVGAVGTLSCNMPSLDPDVTTTLMFIVKTTAPGSVNLVNTATVSSATFDPNLANNSATLVTRVSGK